MDKMEDLPPQRRAEILAARLERSQRALSDAENALESRMKQLFRANQDLSLRESELARKAWLIHPANTELVFSNPDESTWRETLRQMNWQQRLLADGPDDLSWN